MKQEAAEVLALKALNWLISNDELLPVFMGASGVSVDDLKQRAGEIEFLASVLDFLIMDDEWIVSFCDAENYPYESPMIAKNSLPGAAQIHWT